MVEPIRDLLHSTMHSEQASSDNRWTGMLHRELQTAMVELVATLGSSTITLDKVVDLKVGDVVPIEIGDTIQTMVDGVAIMESRYGIQNGQYALKVKRFLAEEEA